MPIELMVTQSKVAFGSMLTRILNVEFNISIIKIKGRGQ